jgi:hypothetical protein
MARDSKAFVGHSTRGSASIEDTDEASSIVTVATGRWAQESTTQRDQARSQVLWMVDRARRAAENGCPDDAWWWRDRAISALWNMN